MCDPGEIAFLPESGLNAFEKVLCVNPDQSTQYWSVSSIQKDDNGDPIAPYADMSSQVGYDLNRMWLIICGAWVFLMQAGFAMLEAGSVARKNTINILFKNLLDVSIAALSFWLIGYGIAYGETAGRFMGTSNFALSDYSDSSNDYAGFFFQFAFAATASTIVSGSVAERTKLGAYFIYSMAITAFIYPVVVHWGWGAGFLSAWAPEPLMTKDATSNGMIDFAGSGIVHMVGGFAGLVGAMVVGPRKGRFEVNEDGTFGAPKDMPGHSMVLNSLGVIILWFGWYGFNAGSTLCAFECMDLAAKVAVNTTLAAAASATAATFFKKATTGKYDLNTGLNAVIGGLVSITAPCSVVDPWAAYIIGIIGAFVYIGFDNILLRYHIDDPLQASSLHGACGIWGLVSVGIFATDANVQFAAYPNTNDAVANGQQIAVQVLGALCILVWVMASSAVVFLGIKYTIGMRVDEAVENAGLDESEHDGKSYIMGKSNGEAVKA